MLGLGLRLLANFMHRMAKASPASCELAFERGICITLVYVITAQKSQNFSDLYILTCIFLPVCVSWMYLSTCC